MKDMRTVSVNVDPRFGISRRIGIAADVTAFFENKNIPPPVGGEPFGHNTAENAASDDENRMVALKEFFGKTGRVFVEMSQCSYLLCRKWNFTLLGSNTMGLLSVFQIHCQCSVFSVD